MSKRRLGKGLNALISNSSKQQGTSNNGVKNISMDLIKLNPYQPRQKFDKKNLEELSQSIKEHGLIQPILVREEMGEYQIVAGERRYKAAMKAGFDKIKAIVSDFDEQQMMEIALIENLQRQDLNPIEEAQAYQKLIEKFDLSQAEVAKRVGKSRSAISNALRLLKLSPQVKKYVSRETLSMGHARALLAIEDQEVQKELAKQIIKNKLTVRETENLVKATNKKDKSNQKKKKTKKRKDSNLIFVEDKLRKILGTKVNIKTGKKKGKVVIEYYSNDDLERIIELLAD